MEVSDAVMHALRVSGRKQADLTSILKVNSAQAAKIYKNLTEEEQTMADWADWEYC